MTEYYEKVVSWLEKENKVIVSLLDNKELLEFLHIESPVILEEVIAGALVGLVLLILIIICLVRKPRNGASAKPEKKNDVKDKKEEQSHQEEKEENHEEKEVENPQEKEEENAVTEEDKNAMAPLKNLNQGRARRRQTHRSANTHAADELSRSSEPAEQEDSKQDNKRPSKKPINGVSCFPAGFDPAGSRSRLRKTNK